MLLRSVPLRCLLVGTCGWAVLLTSATFAAETAVTREWTVDGTRREALVTRPSKPPAGRLPVLLLFHGHGGTMRQMERLGFQTLWPEALIVCPQGLPTVTPRDPEGLRSGWQPNIGDNHDRDLKLVDAMLRTLREMHPDDDPQVFVSGHSNGAVFTYLVWAARNAKITAIAPSAGGMRWRDAKDARPVPVLHIAGKTDDIVPFENQQRTFAALRQHNGCNATGRPWATAGTLVGTWFPSSKQAPVVEVVHPGGHKYPAEAPELIVRFFREVAPPATR